jgi:hypothetical protein
MRTNNRFVQAVGVAAIVGIAFWAISWGLGAFSRILQTVVYFIRFVLLPYSWQIALAVGVLYLLFAAVTSSRNA